MLGLVLLFLLVDTIIAWRKNIDGSYTLNLSTKLLKLCNFYKKLRNSCNFVG